MIKIENELIVRKIFYIKIRNDSEEGKKIKDIIDEFKEFYMYMLYDEVC